MSIATFSDSASFGAVGVSKGRTVELTALPGGEFNLSIYANAAGDGGLLGADINLDDLELAIAHVRKCERADPS